jgi:hypothetical protein
MLEFRHEKEDDKESETATEKEIESGQAACVAARA